MYISCFQLLASKHNKNREMMQVKEKWVPNVGIALNNFLHFTMANIEELDMLFLHLILKLLSI